MSEAKEILVEFITRFMFIQECVNKKHTYKKSYDTCTASANFCYDGTNTADVAVFLPNKKLRAIIELQESPESQGPQALNRLQTMISRVGSGNVWKVSAMEVIEAQKKLMISSSTEKVSLLSRVSTSKCTPCNVRTSESHENGVEIVDRNTIRRNGVLLEKVFNHPDDKCNRGYMWVRK